MLINEPPKPRIVGQVAKVWRGIFLRAQLLRSSANRHCIRLHPLVPVSHRSTGSAACPLVRIYTCNRELHVWNEDMFAKTAHLVSSGSCSMAVSKIVANIHPSCIELLQSLISGCSVAGAAWLYNPQNIPEKFMFRGMPVNFGLCAAIRESLPRSNKNGGGPWACSDMEGYIENTVCIKCCR